MAKAALKKNKTATRSRYKNNSFLKALGAHAKKLRLKRGYSIDRLSKEADQLSPASIDRLEKGTSDSQILVLLRYAEALNISLIELFSFVNENELSRDSRILPFEEGFKPPAGYVPVFPLKVAAGKFGSYEDTEAIQPVGWFDAGIRSHSQDYFATFVTGESMSPRIKNGSLCLFRHYQGGSRQGKIFLIQARGLKDVETGESFVIKKYMRVTPPRQNSHEETPSVIHLVSENPQFPPIVLVGLSDEEITTIAEFVRVL
jgi:hypothetical protein